MVHIRQGLQKGDPNPLGFTLENDILFYKGCYVLAKSSPFISVLLREYHNSPFGGHMGEIKTYLWLASEWFWEGMRWQVIQYVHECQVCQQIKASY